MRWLILAVTGAVLCTLGDHLHAVRGVLVYAHPSAFRQAWWVPLEFAIAAVACVGSARSFLRGGAAPDVRALVGDAIGFLGAYVYTSFAPADRPTVTMLVLVIAFVVRALGERRGGAAIVYCLGLGAAGPLAEGLGSVSGGFHYLHPDLFHTPRWLFGIYLHAGLLAHDIAARFFPAARSAE